MSGERLIKWSERWFRLLKRLYPPDFSDNMGDAVVETYRDRARDALNGGGVIGLAALWVRGRTRAARRLVATQRQLGP